MACLFHRAAIIKTWWSPDLAQFRSCHEDNNSFPTGNSRCQYLSYRPPGTAGSAIGPLCACVCVFIS